MVTIACKDCDGGCLLRIFACLLIADRFIKIVLGTFRGRREDLSTGYGVGDIDEEGVVFKEGDDELETIAYQYSF